LFGQLLLDGLPSSFHLGKAGVLHFPTFKLLKNRLYIGEIGLDILPPPSHNGYGGGFPLVTQQASCFNTLSLDNTSYAADFAPVPVAPRANTASPAALILMAALMSLSCLAPHSGQSHCRTDNGRLSWTNPQPGAEHRLELGKNLSISTRVRPAFMPSGALRLVLQLSDKLTPVGIRNVFGQLWIFDHSFHVQ